jgi:hypothetical protein
MPAEREKNVKGEKAPGIVGIDDPCLRGKYEERRNPFGMCLTARPDTCKIIMQLWLNEQ